MASFISRRSRINWVRFSLPLRADGLRTLAHVLDLPVDVEDQRLQLALEAHVVVRAAQPSLAAELVERDAADRAGLLIQPRQFLGRLADGHLLGHLLRQHGGHARRPPVVSFAGLRQVLPRVLLAEVQLLRLAAGQLGDVERGRLIALLTFHQHELLTTRSGAVNPSQKRGQAPFVRSTRRPSAKGVSPFPVRRPECGWQRYRHQDSNTRPPPVNRSRRHPIGLPLLALKEADR